MATEATLARYVQSVRGKYIDVDRVFGAQCWDQWSHYATNFLGVPSWPTYTNAGRSTPHGGYACNVYHNARAAGLTQWFEILPASATPRAGDVAFWEYGSAWYPWSHVATVLAPPSRGMIRCLTQNPGAVQIADLIMRGIIGYLRPKKFTTGAIDATKTATLKNSDKHREEDTMPKNTGLYYTENKTKKIWYVIANTGSGFYKATTDGKPNTPIGNDLQKRLATAYDLAGQQFFATSEAEASDLRVACSRVRANKA
ncbi:MAG: hypothetical protein WDA07_13195 [Leucobacter sp.]